MYNDIGAEPLNTASRGRLVRGAKGRINTRARIDTEGAQGQISQINVTAATNSETYSVRVQGTQIDRTVTAVTDGSATQTELRDALIVAIKADPLVMAYASSVVAGTNIVLITWKAGSPIITLTFPLNPSTDLTLTNTAAVAAPQYLYGEAAEVVANAAQGPFLTSGIRRPVEIAGVVFGLSIVHNAADNYTAKYLIDGGAVDIAFTAGANAAATDLAAKAALDAALPTGTTTVIDSTGELTVSFTPGVTASIIDAGASDDAGTFTTVIDSAAAALPTFCLVIDDYDSTPVDPDSERLGPTIGSAPLTADKAGVVWSTEAPDTTPSEGDPVYVETDGADRGRLFAVPSLTRILWADASWVGIDPQNPLNAHVAL